MKKTIYLLAFVVAAFFTSCEKKTAIPNLSSAKVSGDIYSIAGNGTQGFSGDGGRSSLAQLHSPSAVALDGSGNIYIVDQANCRIRKINTLGIISTIAGNGVAGFGGDGGPATSAELNYPVGLALDASGNIYIADNDNSVIRKINASGIISTFAGGGYGSTIGDGGPATSAQLLYPNTVALDDSGNVYISDEGHKRIRKVNKNNIISTVAGNGTQGYTGDGGPATSAELSYPNGVTVDASYNIYIADWGDNCIRKVNINGIIITITGNGKAGYVGDEGPATAAELNGPTGVTVDVFGNIYIPDFENNRVRMINTSGTILTIAGNGIQGFTGLNGPATAIELNGPSCVALDAIGDIYFTDYNNNRLVEIYK